MKAVIGSEIQYLTRVHLWLHMFTCCNFLQRFKVIFFLKVQSRNSGSQPLQHLCSAWPFVIYDFSFSQFLVSGMWRIVVPQHKLMKKLWHLNTPQSSSRYTVRLCVTVVQIPKEKHTIEACFWCKEKLDSRGVAIDVLIQLSSIQYLQNKMTTSIIMVKIHPFFSKTC